MVTQDKEDYSDYSRHITTVMTEMTVINGFIFTAIISLLTKLEQPSMLYSQLLFLLLAILFDLNGLLIQHLTVETLYFCRKLPPQTRKVTIRVALMFVIASLFGFAIPLMFLIFDLVTLASVSAIIWLFGIAAYLALIFKPLKEFRKKR
jgi:hypothetical protein